MEVAPTAAPLPPLDPNADPRTPLGELRARYLPIWSPDLDWAFPPEICGSDWALDAIAQRTSGADPAILGDAMAAAALSVMRYEFLLSGALAQPAELGQLCIAVGSIDPVRAEALDLLVAHIGAGSRSAEPAGYPDGVTVVAANATAVLAVACVTPGYPAVVTASGEILDGEPAPAGLQAYVLALAHGLEDAVGDVSYRVANVTHRPAEDCGELDSWIHQWEQQVEQWAAEGTIWGLVGRTVTAGELCDAPPPGGPDECPRLWGP